MRILVTGAAGLVGSALVEHCSGIGDAVISYDHKGLDITDARAVEAIIVNERPEAVINCAAWTDVDGCESDSEKARQSNALGPENLAKAARKADVCFITIYTDYVFDGQK